MDTKLELNIQFNDLNAQWQCIKGSAQIRIDQLFAKSCYIGGPDIAVLEENYAKWNKTNFAIGCSNGTDAIVLALKALDLKGSIGIFLPANTYIATLIAAESAYPNASFHLIDCDDYFQIDCALLAASLDENRSKYEHAIIIPVHLYGHTVDIKSVQNLAKKSDCIIIEDASQAHGALGEDGIQVGSFGLASAFSLYPGKNLGAAGDAGIITTNSEALNKKIRTLRNLGSAEKYKHEVKGPNNRMDTFQAIIVDEKLKYLDQWNDARNAVVNQYNEKLKNDLVILPKQAPYCEKHVYHIYCVRIQDNLRDEFQAYLAEHKITTVIHYPIPMECSGAYSYLNVNNKNTRKWANEIISLPIHPFLKEEEIDYICNTINNWRA